MFYLAIMIVVAAAGILRLWLYQRKERTRLTSVDEFKSSLERISAGTGALTPVRPTKRVRMINEARVVVDSRPSSNVGHAHPAPLDPNRRAAAKRRIEARRRAMGIRAAS